MNRMSRMVLILAFAAAGVPTLITHADDKPAPARTQKPLEWSKKPPKDWPQFVLTHDASFKGHSPLKGASAFLMRMSDNDVLLVTARHLIGADGGVEPPVDLADFDKALTNWEAFPRTKPTARIAISGLAFPPEAGQRHDWLLLHLKDPKGQLPATPMRPRIKRAEAGDAAYLIGVPYSDAKSSQNVYKGRVTKRPSRNYFELEFEPAVKLAGFSGAPVVDQDGYLLGMMTTSPESKRKDGLQTVCWCQDISLGYSLWKKKKETTPEKPKAKVQLALPEGWKEEASTTRNVVMSAEHPGLDATIVLQVFPADNLKEVMTLKDWAKRNEKMDTWSKLENLSQTESKTVKIGGREAMQYDVSGKIEGLAVRYRMIMFERNDCYCNLLCWTFEENWTKAQPKFEDVFKAIK